MPASPRRNRNGSPPVLAACVAVLLASTLAPASAAGPDWVDQWHNPSASSLVLVHSAWPLPSGGFVLNEEWRALWYDADGSLLRTGSPLPLFGDQVGFATSLLEFREAWSPFSLAPFSQDDSDCDFVRLDDGTIARQYGVALRHGDNDVRAESRFTPGPEGVHYVWRIESNAMFRVSLDCHATPVPFEGGKIRGLVNAAGSVDAFVLSLPADDPLAAVRLQRIRPDGAVVWTRQLPAGVGYPFAADPTGGVLVGGLDPDDAQRFTAMRIDGEGATAWTGEVRVEGSRARAIVPASGGGATLWLYPDFGEPGASGAAVQFDATGAIAADTRLSPLWPTSEVASTAATPPPWRLALPPPDGGITAAVVGATATGLETLIEPDVDTEVLAHTHDGRLVLRAGAPADSDARLRLVDPADGTGRDLDLPDRPVRTRAATVAADADGIAWIAHDDAGGTRLRMLDGDGALRWQRELTPSEISDEERPLHPRWRLELSPDEVCATRRRNEVEARADVTCVARADGAVTVPLQQVADAVEWAPQLLRSGSARTLLYSRRACTSPSACQANLLRRPMAADGTLGAVEVVLATSPGNNAHFTEPASLGRHGVALGRQGLAPDHGAVLRIDSAGNLAWLQPMSDHLAQVHGSTDGRVLRVTLRAFDSQQFVGEYSLDGELQWTHPVDLPFDIEAAGDPDGWVLAGAIEKNTETRQALLRLHSADGSTAWRAEHLGYPTYSYDNAVVTVDGTGTIAWLRQFGQDTGAEVEWRALADGALLGADSIPTSAIANGHLAEAAPGALVTASSDAALLYRFTPPAAPQAISADLLGSWFEPETTGQGLFLGTVPDSDVVYGGWFTYVVGGSNDRAHQRWYTLGGTLLEDGTAELTIFETRGGQFAEPPAVESAAVGTATLRLDDCNAAQLLYAFDPPHNEGFAGSVALQRTVAGTCEGEPSTAAGLAGGAFFEPAASGQGVFLEPLRTGADSRLAGLWFTFDPADAADDPTAQHWFTMLSDPIGTGADANVATLTIMRTIGAGFDAGATHNTHRVGTAQLQVESCEQVELTYAMDNSDLAGAYAGATGSLALQRIGACPAGRAAR